jgi:hypothetical protein
MSSAPAELLEALAADIGEAVYMDVANWHLYLNDAKLHTRLAEKFYPLMAENDLSAAVVAEVLKTTQVTLGGGRRQVPLQDLIPSQCEGDLLRVLEDFQAKL